MMVLGGGRSDRGRVRPHNEDSFLAAPDDGLFAVADGMGGHAAGEVASRLAIEAVGDILSPAERDHTPIETLLRRTIDEANRRIAATIRDNPDCTGMGTTLVVGVVVDDTLWIAHVGDSRAYLVRDGALRQLTTDHSLVNELVRLGILSRDKASSDPRRNVVTRALGSGMTVTPDLIEQALEPGDVVILCSDGLNTMLADDAIAATVSESGDDPDRICEALVEAANMAGGEDNVSVVAVRAKAEHAPPAETDTERASDGVDTIP